MAIEYTLLLKDKKISEENLVKRIESFGYVCNRREQLTKGVWFDLNEEIGFSVFLVDSANYPYNSWEIDFLKDDFIYEQFLKFRFSKEYLDFEKRYEVMLKIIFDLENELNVDAILVRNGDTELCFFRENKTILLNNESGVWNMDCFKDVIINRDVCYT